MRGARGIWGAPLQQVMARQDQSSREWAHRNLSLHFLAELELLGAVWGSLGDLCRATTGVRETEPKQIGEGTPDSTEPAFLLKHSDICSPPASKLRGPDPPL